MHSGRQPRTPRDSGIRSSGRNPNASEERKSGSQSVSAVCLTTNFYPLASQPDEYAFIYSITTDPLIDENNAGLVKMLISKVRRELRDKLGSFVASGWNLVSIMAHREPIVFSNIQGYENTNYTIQVMFENAIDLLNPIHRTSASTYLNIIGKELMSSLDLKRVSSQPKYFDIRQKIELPQASLSLYKGFDVRFNFLNEWTLNRGFFFLADFATKVVQKATVLDMITSVGRRDEITDMLVGKIVMINYGNNMSYKVSNVDFNMNPRSRFMNSEGRMVSFIDYYRSQYGINIRNTDQPLLEIRFPRRNKVIHLIPELCFLTGLTDSQRNSYEIMNQLAQHTRLSPNDRFNRISGLMNTLMTRPEAQRCMSEFGVSLNPNPVTVEAKVIPIGEIKQGKNTTTKLYKGGFNLDEIYRSAPIERWILFSTNQDKNNASKLARDIKDSCDNHGIPLGEPELRVFNNLSGLISDLQEILSSGSRHAYPSIILVVLPRNMNDLYAEVKQVLCNHTRGVISQCIRSSNLGSKRYENIKENLVYQIAAKTGSCLWSLPRPAGLHNLTMVVGMDVHHDAQVNRSVVGFSSSLDSEFLRYYHAVRFQSRPNEEIIPYMQEFMNEALNAFKQRNNNTLPGLIIIFRDGVGDSQIPEVKDREYSEVMQAIRQFTNYEPAIIYTVVNKRVNTKFFTSDLRNAPAGSCIRDSIVPRDKDFYLVAHTANQGIAKPTLYRVIETSNIPQEREDNLIRKALPELAMKLCYLYYNWRGGIKVPAPVMLSHKISYFVGQYLHQEGFGSNLNQLPFFL